MGIASNPNLEILETTVERPLDHYANRWCFLGAVPPVFC